MSGKVNLIKKFSILSVFGLAVAAISQVQAQTIDTRIGKLQFKNDYPTSETVDKLNHELLFQAATQVHMWGLPLVAVASV